MGFESSFIGINVATQRMDAIGSNIANANTVGYKGMTTTFGSVLSAKTVQQFTQGTPTVTGNALDVAILGKGFFQVERDDGSMAYTRNGQFHVNKDGYLATASGDKVMGTEGAIKIDFVNKKWTTIAIGQDGLIRGTDDVTRGPDIEYPPGSGKFVPGGLAYIDIAKIALFNFKNQQGLKPIDGGLWLETSASNTAIAGAPGLKSLGVLRSGEVEASNVDLDQSLVEMIITQRAYQGNAQVMKAQIEVEEKMAALKT